MKCEVCEERPATRKMHAQGFDFMVCEECSPGVDLTASLIDAVVAMGIPALAAVNIIDTSIDDVVGKLTN